jgi:hypothetical protein
MTDPKFRNKFNRNTIKYAKTGAKYAKTGAKYAKEKISSAYKGIKTGAKNLYSKFKNRKGDNMDIKLLESLALEENIFHSIGDKVDNTVNNSGGFLKGLGLGAAALAAFSNPETAEHVKDALSGIGHTFSDAYHNMIGDAHQHAHETIQHVKEATQNTTQNQSLIDNLYHNYHQLDQQLSQPIGSAPTGWDIVKGVGEGAALAALLGGGGYALYKNSQKSTTTPSSGLSKKINNVPLLTYKKNLSK